MVNGVLEYDIIEINDNSLLTDLSGAVLDVKLVDDNDLEVTTFIPSVTGDGSNILYSDKLLLKDLVYNISFSSSGILSIDKVGDF